MDYVKTYAEEDISFLTNFLKNEDNRKLFPSILNECVLIISSVNNQIVSYPVLQQQSDYQPYSSLINILFLTLKYNLQSLNGVLPFIESDKEPIQKIYDELLNRKSYINDMHIESAEIIKPKGEKVYPCSSCLDDSYLSSPFDKIVDIKWRMLIEIANTYNCTGSTPVMLVSLIVLHKGKLIKKEIVCGESELEHWINTTVDALSAVEYKLK